MIHIQVTCSAQNKLGSGTACTFLVNKKVRQKKECAVNRVKGKTLKHNTAGDILSYKHHPETTVRSY
jgi:hypothetical protein